MCEKLTPLVHLRARAREILADQLAYEGVSDDGRGQADGLAVRMWDFATADQLMLEIKDVFPADSPNELLRFCKREYPVLYSALPVSITGESLQLFRSKCPLLGGGHESVDGVRVGCLSPGQLEPHWGKKGELKRWKQFLIRGDPKRGKRSFQRAQRRADKHGQTVYKGKIMCSRSGVDLCPTKLARQPSARASRPVARSQVLCWNAGGLCGEAKVEFEHYLQTSPHIDIFLAQETHWGSSGSWTQQGWTYFYSAAEKPRQAGVLVGIRSSTLDASQTAWREIVPGRLLWTRASIRGQQWDLLNLYQVAQAGRDGETKEYRVKERRVIWNKLHRTLRGLPVRSLGGDFNLSVEVFSPVTGCGVVAGSAEREAREERAKVLEIHRLSSG